MVNQKINLFLILFFLVACNGNYSGNERDFKNSLNFQAKSFVAVGDAGSIITSDDGLLWDSITSGTINFLNGVSFVDNTLVVVGNEGTILKSWNNSSWSPFYHGNVNIFKSVTFGHGFYMFTQDPGGLMFTEVWDDWPEIFSVKSYNDIAFDETSSYFLAVGEAGAICKIEDMENCSEKNSGTSRDLKGVNFSNDKYIAVGNSGTIIASSDGGNTWNTKTSGTSQDLLDISYKNNSYVVVGSSGVILTSSDGDTWSSKNSGTTKDLYGITYGKNKFVAVGMEGTILTSTDTESWIKRSSGIIVSINDVTYKNN